MTEFDKDYEPIDIEKYPRTKEYNDALNLANSDNLDGAWSLLHIAHKKGDPRASYAIASWYAESKPPIVKKKNFKKSIEYLACAVNAGVPNALLNYAIFLELGRGIKKDENLALTYYVTSALLGNEEAKSEVSRLIYHGIVFERSELCYDLLQ